jgi:ABC-2 type transport system permease protein
MTDAIQSFGLLFRWQFLRIRQDLVLLVFIQVALALGVVYGLALLIPDIDSRSAMFLATGAPTVTLLILGLSVVPQEVSRAKDTGRAAYISTLPVPRLAPPAAEVAFWLLAQLPGTVLAVVVASIRFDFALNVRWEVIPAVLLVALSGAAVGYALAGVFRPQAASQIASFLAIVILLFSPINFPADRLPDLVEAIHAVLPIKYMADLVRWSLTGRFADDIALAFGIVTLWCALGVAVSWRVAVRRP